MTVLDCSVDDGVVVEIVVVGGGDGGDGGDGGGDGGGIVLVG